jgi:hypothetical protein
MLDQLKIRVLIIHPQLTRRRIRAVIPRRKKTLLELASTR